MKQTIGVFFWGQSPEHDVSITSAYAVMRHLQRCEEFLVIPVYVDKQGKWYSESGMKELKYFQQGILPEQEVQLDCNSSDNRLHLHIKNTGRLGTKQHHTIDTAFVMFHGQWGEDGSFQWLLDFCGVPYVWPSCIGAAMTLDKKISKDLLRQANLPSIPGRYANHHEPKKLEDIETTFGYPCFVKPYNGWSSIGVSKCNNRQELQNAIEVGYHFAPEILIEQAIQDAIEISCSIYEYDGNLIVSEIQEIISKEEFLTFEQKYIAEAGGGGQSWSIDKLRVPAQIPTEAKEKIQDYCKQMYRLFRLTGAPRIDFFYKPNTQEIFIIEINTIPGSMQMVLREKSGIDQQTFLRQLISQAHQTLQHKKSYSIDFQSSVLQSTMNGMMKK
jgi:D-alanine-D-alanine ligase